MDNRSRGFRLAAAAVMLVFLLAVSAFAMAEADPIRVSSLSEPQSVISEQDVSCVGKKEIIDRCFPCRSRFIIRKTCLQGKEEKPGVSIT